MIEDRLRELKIELPKAGAPVANYTPYKIVGNFVFISGQVAKASGELLFKGKLGENLSTEDGKVAAKICALNVIAQLKDACDGDLDKVKSCIKLGVFVNASENFIDHPLVANGASDLIVEIFGERGKHTRSAVGSNSLPLDSAVEVEAIFEI